MSSKSYGIGGYYLIHTTVYIPYTETRKDRTILTSTKSRLALLYSIHAMSNDPSTGSLQLDEPAAQPGRQCFLLSSILEKPTTYKITKETLLQLARQAMK